MSCCVEMHFVVLQLTICPLPRRGTAQITPAGFPLQRMTTASFRGPRTVLHLQSPAQPMLHLFLPRLVLGQPLSPPQPSPPGKIQLQHDIRRRTPIRRRVISRISTPAQERAPHALDGPRAGEPRLRGGRHLVADVSCHLQVSQKHTLFLLGGCLCQPLLAHVPSATLKSKCCSSRVAMTSLAKPRLAPGSATASPYTPGGAET